jgi:hypothetical protein
MGDERVTGRGARETKLEVGGRVDSLRIHVLV